jgi:AcrR family transcriptional regulator
MVRRRNLDRSAIVAAAAAIADAQGLDQLTLAAVAARLEVRVPSLYNHVAGLDGLRREVALMGMRRLTDSLRRAAVGKARGEAIMALALAFREFVRAHYGLYQAALKAPDPEDRELFDAGEEVVQVVALILEPYHFSGEDLTHALRGLRSIVHGFASLERAGGFGRREDCDESFRRLVQTFIDGLDQSLVTSGRQD